MFFVKKKQGDLQRCIDYWSLNTIVQKDRYPMPLMNSAFDAMSGRLFSSHCQGITNTLYAHALWPDECSHSFSSLLMKSSRETMSHYTFVYLDDILTFSNSLEEHFAHVYQVLQYSCRTISVSSS